MTLTRKLPLIGLTLTQLREVAFEAGLPKFAATQMAQWLYDKRVDSIEQMTNLSKSARENLSRLYDVGICDPVARAESSDGTVKFLFSVTESKFDIEAVYIPDGDRATLCVSSQAGCKMGCEFCMTGKQGFHGNLSAYEIINQIIAVDRMAMRGDLPVRLTNIVFMGMGEPLDNLDSVMQAIEVLTEKWGLAWSPKRITVSSIGKLKELKRLIEGTKVHVAISVHVPIPSQRERLMPVERAYPINDVISLLRDYDFAHQRRLSVEYIMWKGVNDSLRYADTLAKLIKGTAARVNLIRFHAIPGVDMEPSSQKVMEDFRDRLNKLGITATIRASRGEDIMAACGMLAGKNKTQNHKK